MKRICPNCGTRYYDFRKEPPACPVCATAYDPEALLKSRRSKALPVEEAPKRKKVAAVAVADELTGEDLVVDPELAPDLEDDEADAEVVADAEAADDTLLEDDADDLDDEIEEVDVGDEEES
jgi:uncharacterized protein (TIGR02300 family)